MHKECPRRQAFSVCHHKDTYGAVTDENALEVGSVAQGHPEHEIYYCTYPTIFYLLNFIYVLVHKHTHAYMFFIVVIDTDYFKYLYPYI